MAASCTLLAILVAIVTTCHGQGSDFTLQQGAFGSAVVRSVIDRIRSRCIFSEDRLYLQRVAYVISRDGSESFTYRTGFDGGIWQVKEDMFLATRNCSNVYLQPACNNISVAFNISWPTVTWSELRKPLYSGLAAALSALLTLGQQSMPGNISDQADIWAMMFSRPRQEFSSVGDQALVVACSDTMDLAFILDSSGSISRTDYSLMLQFAADVVNVMNVSRDAVRIADIVFSSTAEVHFDLDDFNSKDQIRTNFISTPKLDSGTDTAAGLDQTAITLYDENSGARENVKKVAVLVTDGMSNNPMNTIKAAERLKNLGTTLFTVGVGNYDPTELKAVASDPICSHVLTLTSFDHIQSILTEIQHSACDANLKLTPSGNISKSTEGSTTAEVQVPDKNTSTIVEVTCGILDVYVSTSDRKPGPAVYDERFHVTPTAPAVLTFQDVLDGTLVYITVMGTRLPASVAALKNCSDFRWTLSSRPKTNITVICKENGVERPCSSSDIVMAGLCDKNDADYPIDNPCTAENIAKGLMRHSYPYDPTKFVQCDLKGRYYLTQCPDRSMFNSESRGCGFISPIPSEISVNDSQCSAGAVASGQIYHPYPLDKTKFIQCDEWGMARIVSCNPPTKWSQDDHTCISDAAANSPVSGPQVMCSNTDDFVVDPCDHHSFYRCVFQQAVRQTCFPSTLYFHPLLKVCDYEDTNPAAIPVSCTAE